MQEQPCTESYGHEIEVALRGGPDGLPDRFRMAGAQPDTLKIPFRNGYEHFSLTAELAAAATPVFSWTMRTRLAE